MLISILRRRVRFLASVLWLGCGFVSVQAAPEWSPSATEGWKPVVLEDLLVKEGSALDFSNLVEPGPAGKHGKLQINAAGQFVFEKQPGKPVRFFSCSNPMEYWAPETPEEIAEYAKQVRLAGYNCFRAHYLDLMLMIDTDTDHVPNPKQFQRWDLLAAELKKQGVYLYVDISSIWYSYYGNKVRGKAWGPEGRKVNLTGRMYWEPAAREHWAKGARLLLEHVNPYTGLALKDDPQVIIFGLRNEAGIHFSLTHYNKNREQESGLIGPFRTWLQKRYQTIEALNKAWRVTTPYTDFEAIPFPAREGVAPATADLQRFIVDTELELLTWMKGEIQKIGTHALIQDYNVGVAFGNNLTRSALPMVETHSYHDHPSAYINAGSTMANESAASMGMAYVSWANEVQQLDRPFIVTEWGYPYWNQWRYEAGLSAPAYGALQGWQMLNHSHEPIHLQAKTTLRPFKIPHDPPEKIAERMAVLLFARGDVSPSTHTVEVKIDPEGVFSRWGGDGYMPPAIRRLTLLLHSGIRVVSFSSSLTGAPIQVDASLRIHPTAQALVWESDPEAKETPDVVAMVEALRKRKLLPASNRTDAAAGIFQSDTGQLTLDTARKIMTVDTPRSQAAALPTGSAPVKLKDVDITNQGESASFFVGSLDAVPLVESKRLLILSVGDAINSGAVFTDKNRKVLKELGSFPILAKSIRAEIVLRRPLAKNAKVRLWALAFNGDRIKEVPVQVAPDQIKIQLNTTEEPHPIFQYELVVE
ncbi:MAG: hypothetical protein B9S32_02835 [Verrucomicrobia bacterium Tous-C9LFEB]|nr:MAG: hypothetical protein B9S32_02835 [Verrucomicrobia bacterium Tous-C9LFEB]